MSVFGRLERPPSQTVRVAALAAGERLLASAHLVGGGWALATTARLVIVGDSRPDLDAATDTDTDTDTDDVDVAVDPASPVAHTTRDLVADPIPWVEVVAAALEAEVGVIDVSLVDGSQRALLLGRGYGDRLARVIRERVQHSVLLTRTVELRGRRTVAVTARRGATGGPFIQIVPGPGVDLRGADVAAAVAEAEDAVRDQVGLGPRSRP